MSPSPEAAPGLQEFSREERSLLLKLAHQAIASALDRSTIAIDAPSAHLAEPRGAFTTLYWRGNLRGCVGYVEAVASVYRTVIATSRAAAFEDTRFWPVTREELPELQVSLSILTKPAPIQPGQIEIGVHGLIVTFGGHRGLLLPQVPLEHGWDRTTFLEQTCRKAGLPLDAWEKGAAIQAFRAEIFSDGDMDK
jgi:AmmeMemoRadiSam system protein A